MPEVRFDDIPALRALIREQPGDYGPATTVTQDMINRFADVTGDHQWIHTDVDRATRESPFGGPIAHGFLVLSLLPSLADGDDLRIVGQKSTVNYGADKLRFIAPVPAGAAIHARRRLVGADSKSGGTLLTVETEVSVVGAERPALVYRSLALYLP